MVRFAHAAASSHTSGTMSSFPLRSGAPVHGAKSPSSSTHTSHAGAGEVGDGPGVAPPGSESGVSFTHAPGNDGLSATTSSAHEGAVAGSGDVVDDAVTFGAAAPEVVATPRHRLMMTST